MMGDGGGMGMAAGWGWVFLILVLVGLTALVVLLVRLASGGLAPGSRDPGPADPQRQARAILDERYAKGEIDSEEYEERRGRLRDDR